MRFLFVMGRVFSGLAKNLAMTISVILVTFVSALFVGIGALAQIQVSAMQQEWYAKVEVTVYMCAQDDQVANCQGRKATKAQIDKVKKALESAPLDSYIKEVTFQDHDAVYKDFSRQYGDTQLGEAISPEMLPQAFQIKLKDPSQYKVISERISGMPGVEQVQDQSQLVQPLISAFKASKAISWGLAATMGIAAILLITTTIRLSAMARQKETQIMRLEGASALFIQLPFMLEGAISALLGTLVACGTLALGVKYLVQDWMHQTIRFVDFVDLSDVLFISGPLVGGALILALVASAFSLSKYTKI